MGQMGKWPWRCTTTGLDNSTELRMEKIHQAVTEIWVPQVWQPPARPPGWGVKTLNGVNPSSSFRDMHSANSGPNLWQIWQVFGPWASPYGANGQMTVHNYRPRQFYRTSNGENPSSGYRDMGSASLAVARPAGHPPEPWRQDPSSPKGWGVKRCDSRTDGKYHSYSCLVAAKNMSHYYHHYLT